MVVNKNLGFSLIEILVSMIVISVSFLGAISLQMTALKESQVSFYRNYATTISQSVIEQIRAQPNDASNFTITSAALASLPASSTSPTIDFKNSVVTLLPNGAGSITVSSANKTVVVNLSWNEGKVLNGSNAEQFTYESQY